MKWPYFTLAGAVILILGFGLTNLVKEDLQVAPWTKKGAMEGRLTMHTKNVTRVLQPDAEALYQYIKKTINYEGITLAANPPTQDSWTTFVQQSIPVNPNARHVLVLPSENEEALQWSLPALYYAYYYGSPIIFVQDSNIEESQAQRYQHLTAYLIGPEELIPSSVGEKFRQSERIAGRDLADHAVHLAEYRDEATEFGWGREEDRQNGYFHYVVTTPKDALMGLAALPFARSNNASLLYTAENGSVPASTDRYTWTQRADWFVSPSEGPFRHFWVVSPTLSYGGQSRMDFSVEKAEYASLGPIALGYMEGLMIMFIALGIASAIFVGVHASNTLSMVNVPMKVAWTMSSLMLPIVGPLLYITSYRRPAYQTDDGTWHWLRPQNIQSAAATVMGFGYGAPLMVAIGFLFVWFGFPLNYDEWLSDFVYWLGAGMPIMMIGMFILSVLIAWGLAQYPMKKMMMDMPPKRIAWMSFKTTLLSMAAVSLGMMTLTWWMLMDHIPMMPKEDDILWFGSLWAASFIGFLIAWPFNWFMIRNHLKPGNV
uniref:DUF4396 domain-containing protein n=1 Tax=Roseihalotalea indica TaxID=2867963 RepID=A0AA49GPH9_9BACT|nr:DUF4396 domain-containing protein [Tunicatimonas sp. TK19036]